MGIPHLRDASPRTAGAIQTKCVPFKPVADALESNLGHNPELRIPGDVYRHIPV